MQLKKYYRKLSRNLPVDIGTPKNPCIVPRWQAGKPQEQVAQTIRSRNLNPQDPLFLGGSQADRMALAS